jgi:hypothetical protein
MINESQLVSQIKNFLKSKGAYCEKIFGGGFQASGIPDILCCYKGLFIGIEVKSPTGKGRASDVQKLKIKAIRNSGGVAFITDNLKEVERIFELIDNNDFITYNDYYF